MRHSFDQLLIGVSVMLSMTNAQFNPPKDDCDNENFINSPVSGAPWDHGSGNTYFCDTKWKHGILICGIQTWANKYHQSGFKLKYSDDTWGPVHGKLMQADEGDNWTDYEKNTVEWDCSKPLQDLRMISNYAGFSKYASEGVSDAVGGIRLTPSGGAEFKVQGDIGKFSGTSFELGSGFLVGARGRAGGFLDTLEWRLLASPVQSAEIKSMKFKKDLNTVNKKSDGVTRATLGDFWWKNSDTKGEKGFDFTNEEVQSTTTAITHSTSHQFGVTVGLTVKGEIGVPLLAKSSVEAKVETSYTLTKMDQDTLTTEAKHTLKWSLNGKIPPQKAVHCKSWAFSGTYTDEYTAIVAITFKNGKTIEVEEPGKFVSVGWTEAASDCSTRPIGEAPKDAKEAGTKRSIAMLKARALGSHE